MLFTSERMYLTPVTAIGLWLVVSTLGAADSDWSLEKMCKLHKGQYQKRPSKETADICELDIPISTDSQEEADAFCNEFFPYHIEKSEHGNSTKCTAEATLICELEWVQMYGRCYKMTWEEMTYAEAEKTCSREVGSDGKALGAKIAFLHRESLVKRWRDYFQKIFHVWIDGSGVYTDGLKQVLKMNGMRCKGNDRWMDRVSENETALVLCEYSPPANEAESIRMASRYDEIYYPALVTDGGVYVRSASSRIRYDSDRLADSDYCTGVLRPFFPSAGGQSAIPTKAFIEEVQHERTGMMRIIRTSVYSHDSSRENRESKMCSVSGAKNYGIDIVVDNNGTDSRKSLFRKVDDVWRDGFPKESCDGATWSTGVHFGRTGPGLETMTDARWAPIYCQRGFKSVEYKDCPVNYTAYMRKNGQKWCHKFVVGLVTRSDAIGECAKDGGYLSGFSDFEEMKLIDRLADSSNAEFGKDRNIWLGAKRREECRRFFEGNKAFETNPSAPCSRNRVFEWLNGVAANPPAFEGLWAADREPDMASNVRNDPELCLALLKGMMNIWGRPGVDMKLKLNDVRCIDQHHHTVCGQEASIVLKTIDSTV